MSVQIKGGAWSQFEVEKLLRLRARGDTFEQVAAALGRTVPSCKALVRRMALSAEHGYVPRRVGRPKPPKWTADEIATLREIMMRGLSYGDAARQIGRSVAACQEIASKHGIAAQATRARHAAKCAEMAPKIRELADAGMSRTDAARTLRMKYERVRDIAAEFGIEFGKPRRSRPPKVAKPAPAAAPPPVMTIPKRPERPPLTFEEKLALVAAGKARVVEVRHFNRQPEPACWSGSQLA